MRDGGRRHTPSPTEDCSTPEQGSPEDGIRAEPTPATIHLGGPMLPTGGRGRARTLQPPLPLRFRAWREVDGHLVPPVPPGEAVQGAGEDVLGAPE